MTNCYRIIKPQSCDYFPECSEGHITRQELNAGESKVINNSTPNLLYVVSGTGELFCNGQYCTISSPAFILTPDYECIIECHTATKLFVFGSGYVKLLADKVGMDCKLSKRVPKKQQCPILLIAPGQAANLALGIDTSYLDCRHYADYKFHEIIHNIEPELYGEIKKTLFSKDWFFRLRVDDIIEPSPSLNSFASALGMSASGFSKRFVKVYGESFYQWYQHKRLESIKRDLLKSDVSFKDLAGKYGFCSVQHLGAFIKVRTGMSPGKLRKSLREGSI